jgi:hypothetical protein
MPAGYNAQQVVDQWGAYYENNGQGVKDLKIRVMQPSVSESVLSDVRETKDQINKSTYIVTSEVTQAFQKDFTPKNNITFIPNELITQEVKIDIHLADFRQLWNSYLGFLKDGKLDYVNMPFVKWYVTYYVYPQHEEDRELKIFHKGVRVEPTPGTAGLAINAADGFGKILADKITAGKITATATGAIATDDELFVDQVTAWVEAAIPRLLRRELEPIRMSEALTEKFARGMFKKYNKQYPMLSESDLLTIRLNETKTSITIAGLPSMEDSERIYTTVKKNSAKLSRFASNAKMMQIGSYAPRQVSGFTEYEMVYGFWYDALVFCNELV